MKVFAIQFPDGSYIKHSRNGFGYYFNRSTTTDPNEALHYRKAGYAKAVITRKTLSDTQELKRYKKEWEEAVASGLAASRIYVAQSIERLTKSALPQLQSLTVVEVDVEIPNIKDIGITKEFKFADGASGFSTKKSMGNCFCKGCGIYFQDIPVVMFGKRSPARICPLCIQERAFDAQKLLDEMKPEQREAYEAERFVHRMG